MTAYRNRPFSLLIVVVATVFFVGSLIAALVRDDAGSTLARIAPVAVVGALSAFCLLRLARAGVYADERGIRVVNPLRTLRADWEEVVRFTLRPDKGFPAVGFAELSDGRRLQIWGLQARSHSPAAKRIPQEVVDALNERLAQERRG